MDEAQCNGDDALEDNGDQEYAPIDQPQGYGEEVHEERVAEPKTLPSEGGHLEEKTQNKALRPPTQQADDKSVGTENTQSTTNLSMPSGASEPDNVEELVNGLTPFWLLKSLAVVRSSPLSSVFLLRSSPPRLFHPEDRSLLCSGSTSSWGRGLANCHKRHGSSCTRCSGTGVCLRGLSSRP